jgi:hypothetical protein
VATRKTQDGGADALLTATARILGSALGRIAVRAGLDGPPKAAKRTTVTARKNVPAEPKKAVSKRVIPSIAKRAKSAARAKKKS